MNFIPIHCATKISTSIFMKKTKKKTPFHLSASSRFIINARRHEKIERHSPSWVTPFNEHPPPCGLSVYFFEVFRKLVGKTARFSSTGIEIADVVCVFRSLRGKSGPREVATLFPSYRPAFPVESYSVRGARVPQRRIFTSETLRCCPFIGLVVQKIIIKKHVCPERKRAHGPNDIVDRRGCNYGDWAKGETLALSNPPPTTDSR